MSKRILGLLGAAIAALAIGVGAAVVAVEHARPAPIPDFAMVDQHGKTLHLSDLRGHYTVVYFGYTHCKDDCPRNMGELAQALRELGSRARGVEVLFISVDPRRDTPAALSRFLDRFDPSFEGADVPQDKLKAIAAEFGVALGGITRARGKGDRDLRADDYDVVHGMGFTVLDPSGRYETTLDEPVHAADLAAALRPTSPW